jgi:peptidoglycan/LPS O-acetylase OafA/YrhL
MVPSSASHRTAVLQPSPGTTGKQKPATISPFVSFALDVLRVGATLGVIWAHVGDSTTRLLTVADLSHTELFVICFFVVSGYVIAATTSRDRMDGKRYLSTRLARLWSVTLPCLAVAFALEAIGRQVSPEHYAHFNRGHLEFRYFLSAIFSNENWFFSAGPPTVRPVWSLAYEAWFYLLFGVAVFVRPVFVRLGLLAVLALIVGPKVLLLFPVWFLGAAAFHCRAKRAELYPWRWPILFGALSIIFTVLRFHPKWSGFSSDPRWIYSSHWVSDLYFGLGVASLILFLDLQWGSVQPYPLLNTAVKKIAGVSFSIYLLHFPLMIFAGAVVPFDRSNPWQSGLVILTILTMIYFFGSFIEPQRKWWRTIIESALERLPRRNSP